MSHTFSQQVVVAPFKKKYHQTICYNLLEIVYCISIIFFSLKSYHYLPIQSGSDIKANLLVGVTSIHNLPNLTTGHDFLHS